MRNKDGIGALWYGVEKGTFAVVNRLLQHSRVKIDLPNCQGQTVFWLAVYRGNRELASLLLSRGANPDIKDLDGFSPWIEACISNKNSIKDLLLDHMKAVSPEMFSKDNKAKFSDEQSGEYFASQWNVDEVCLYQERCRERSPQMEMQVASNSCTIRRRTNIPDRIVSPAS
ncbi:hypothetical protein PENARI_c096G07366 [Penicillium arizonense]|uniref:Uncharacterized protein n=1 Tax=Penicillium arizonense TaxID=1835702 RepID=A0A1F5L0Z7_PENAI|nr:hypothetical protein PENARI_c096G07366 [Penicillium arizonense]OGE46872.1 hypothetical protein PENARI_c096G07366 [Penicillium arizonense]